MEKIGVEAVFGLANFSKGLSDYDKGLDKAEGETGKFVAGAEKKFGGLGDAIGKTGKILGTAVLAGAAVAGAAIVGVGVQGVKSFMDFQTSMNEVFTLLPGISQDAMGQMSDQVKQFSTDFGVLPEEVVPALYQALSAGIPQDNVFAFLEVANKAAVGGASDLTTAVNGISSVVNAYGADVLSAGKASDIMFTTVRLGKTNFQELSDSMFNVGPTAAALGVGFDQVSAALAAMTLQGTPTSVATTQLRSLMVELSKDGSKAAATFERMSGKSFVDFMAAGGDMSQALGVMEKAAAANGVRLSDMFGSVEAGNAALALTGKGAETFNADLKAMQEAGGATDAAFAQMNTGIQDALDDLKVAWAVALLDIGEKLAPFVQTLADLAGQALPYLTAALGKVLDVIGVVTGGFVDLVSVFSNYYGAVLDAGYGTMEAQEAINLFPEALQPMARAIDYTVGNLLNYHAAVLDAGYGTIESQEAISLFPEALQPMARAIDETIGNLLNYHDAVLDAGYGTIESKEAISLFPAALQPLALAFDEVAGAISRFGSGALTEIGLFVTGNETSFTNVKAIWSTVKDAASTLFSSLVTYVSTNLTTWQAQLGEWGKAAWEWVGDAAEQVATKLGEWWTAISGFISNHLPAWQAVLGDWMTAAWFWISTAAAFVVTKLGGWWTALKGYVVAHLPEWITTLKGWASAAWGWIVEAAGLVAGKLGEWLTALKNYVSAHLPEWVAKLKEWAGSLWGWIVDATGLVAGKLGDWLIALKGYVTAHLPEWMTKLKEWAIASWEWIKEVITKIPEKLGEWFTALKKWFDDNKPLFATKLDEWSLLLYSWISSDETKTNTKKAVDDWKEKGLFGQLKTIDTELNDQMLDAKTMLVEWITDAIPGTITAVTDWLLSLFKATDPAAPTVAPERDSAEKRLQVALDKMWKVLGEEAGKAGAKIGEALLENIGLGTENREEFNATMKGISDEMFAFFDPATWYQRGKDIIDNLKKGWNAYKSAFMDDVKLIQTSVIGFFNVTEWYQRGKDVLSNIREGWDSLKSTLLTKVGDVTAGMLKYFTDIDWKKIGSDIIEGIWAGMDSLQGWLKEKIASLTDALPLWAQEALGIKSPSTVFAEIGVDIIQGLIVGLEKGAPALKRTIEQLAEGITGDFGDASKIGSSFGKAGEDFSKRVKESLILKPNALLEKQLVDFGALDDASKFLEEQSSLFGLIKQQGGDLGAIFGSTTVGLAANSADFMKIVSNALSFLNANTDKALQLALKGYDRLIDLMRQKRQTVADVEAKFADKQLDQKERYEKNIQDLDAQIAQAETDLLTQGGAERVRHLTQLDIDRQNTLHGLEYYLSQLGELNSSLDKLPAGISGRASEELATFRDKFIDPLVEEFKSPLLGEGRQRTQILDLVKSRVQLINAYARNMEVIEQLGKTQQADSPFLSSIIKQRDAQLAQLYNINLAEKDRLKLTQDYTMAVQRLAAIQTQQNQADTIGQQTDFLDKVKKLGDEAKDPNLLKRVFQGIDPVKMGEGDWATAYARFTTESLMTAKNQLSATLREINSEVATQLTSYGKQIELMRQRRMSVDQVQGKIQGKRLDLLESYKESVARIDTQIADVEESILAGGGASEFSALLKLNDQRQKYIDQTEIYIRQLLRWNDTLDHIPTSANKRVQDAVDAFRKAQIDPMMGQFQRTVTNPGRDDLQRLLSSRIAIIQEYVDTADDLATIEKRVTDLMDAANFGAGARRGIEQSLEALYDINREIGSRTGILSSLTNYVGRAEQAFDLFNQIAGDDPLLGRVKSQLVEPLLAQLFVLDQTAQQRADTYAKYSAAVSNLLAIEKKEQAVNDLQERIDLIEKVKALAADLGDKNLFARVFTGMDLTKTLLPQDLATVIARYTDESIRLANNQLQEALKVPIDVEGQLAALRKGRETFEQIQDDFVREPYSQLQHFQDMLNFYDDLIAKGEQEAIEKNSQGFVNYVTTLTNNRKAIVDQTRDFLRQMNDVKRVLTGISTSVDESGTSAVDAFKVKYIDPLVAFMDQFGNIGTRQQLITQISAQVGALNTFITRINQLATIQKQMAEQPSPMEQALSQFYSVTTTDTQRQAILRYMQQIKALGDVERSVAGITGDLADRFREDVFGELSKRVSNFGLSESDRQSALTSLTRYVGQLKLLREVVKDTSAGASINPLVDRFQTDVMDKLLNQFYDLNKSEAERLSIIMQYRAEQEKVLALQTKQSQLDFLQQQLDLLDQAKQLNEKYDDIVNFDAIKSGITFGLNATMDDMLKLTSRVLDAMIATVKSDLGIHSPSKVFAEIGQYMMQGLGQGIWDSRQYPAMAMAGATQQVPYSINNSRAINVNMGGVAINNGMDDVMFEARIRQVVEGML